MTKPKSKPKPTYSPMPVDFLLLAMMPEKGTVGGVHWKGRRAMDLHAELSQQLNGALVDLPMSQLTARLRSMSVMGYCESFGSAASNQRRIWARTEAGSAFLARKSEVLG